jgi:hypothetical protein
MFFVERQSSPINLSSFSFHSLAPLFFSVD